MADGHPVNRKLLDEICDEVVAENAAWDDPDRTILNPTVLDAPPVPIELMGSMAQWCADSAISANAPVDYVAGGLIAHVAGVVGNNLVVVPYPENKPEWREPLILWGVIVGPPSSGKTPALQPFDSALAKIERKYRKDYEEEMKKYDAECVDAKIHLSAWKADCKKSKKDDEDVPERPTESFPPNKPTLKRIRISDVTIEKLARLLGENPRGLLLFRDELSALIGNLERNARGGTDRPHYLETFGAGTIIVDRVSEPEPIIVEQASLSILGGIQPAKLEQMNTTEEDGLHARFMYFFPAGAEFVWCEKSPDQTLLLGVFERLRAIHAQTQDGVIIPNELKLETNAQRAVFFEFEKEVRRLSAEYDGHMSGWIGKGSGVVLRLAGVLCLLDWAGGNEIQPPKEMPTLYLERAIKLWKDYLLPMAKRAFSIAGNSKQEIVARRILRECQSQKCTIINIRTVERLWPLGVGGEKKRQIIDAACELLKEAGWLKKPDFQEGPGRKRLDLEVNPKLFGSFDTFGKHEN